MKSFSMWLKTFFLQVAVLFVCFLLWTNIPVSFASETEKVFRPVDDKAKMMAPYLEYLRDPKGTLKIGDMADEMHNFRPVVEPTNLGYTKIVYWIRFTIDLKFYNEPEWFLIKEFYRGFVTLYYPSANGFTAISIDDALPLRSRDVKLRDYIFKIPSARAGPVTYYMRIDPRGNAVDLNFSWAGVNGALEDIAKKDFWLNLFFGCLLAMWLYNAFLYSYVRDKAYLYYIYYLGCFIGIFLDATGTIALFFDVPPFLTGLFPMCTYGALHGASLFARRFLNLPSTMPKVDRYLRYFQWVLLLAACSTFLLPISFNFYLTTYAVVGIFPVLLGAGLYRCCQGYTPAWVYCAGWLVFGVLSILYALFTQGILPGDSIASHGIYTGAVWESILFSLALGYRIKLIDKEKKEVLEIERNQLEKRVAERTESLKASLESRRMMLANASHELRTPVNALRLLLDSGSNTVSSNIRIMGSVSTIANHMSQLVENLLLLDEGSQTDQRGLTQDFDLGDEIRATAAMLGPLRHNSGASFHLDVEACSRTIVRGDLTSLRRVIINLLSNAFKFTEQGSVSLIASIDESSSADKFHMLIRVIDTGSGISSRMRDQIFGAFVTSGAQGGHTGTGLGLAISRQLAQNMGGDLILARSEFSGGSEFEFRACFEMVAHSQAGSSDKQLPLQRDLSCASQLNILVAEDDPLTAQAVLVIVKQLRHVATHVETYDELCRALRRPEGTYDVALIDHRLPGGNGLGAIADCRVAGIAATTRMVLVTADVTPEVMKAARDICDNIITKPTTGQVLQQLLGEGPRIGHPVADLREMVDAGPLTMLGRCGAQYQALVRMCATFNKTMGDALLEIDGKLGQDGDLNRAELAKLIHRIRGSCATIGATVLAEELQKFAACDNRATAQQQYALTVDTFYSTRRALHALLATLRAT